MPEFRRAFRPGGTFFFTHVTYKRRRILTTDDARNCLRRAIESARDQYPFEIDAFVLLPDHLHCIWTLPEDDADFPTRWKSIKTAFTREFLQSNSAAESTISAGMKNENRRGVWQRRYWEHTIRTETSYYRFCDYIHFNPVKHGHSRCPHAWPWSSFHRFVEENHYPKDWCCDCNEQKAKTPEFDEISDLLGE